MSRWYRYRDYLESRYGSPVYRIGVDGGFSCPNRNPDGSGGCAFCDGTGSKAVWLRSEERFADSRFRASDAVLLHSGNLEKRKTAIAEQIEQGVAFVKERYRASLFSLYFQAWTNTYADIEKLKTLYDFALSQADFTEFIISTRPDEIDERRADLIAGYASQVEDVWVELGLQSGSDKTLERIDRGHTVECYRRALKMLHLRGVKVSTHVILGLPGEGAAEFVETARVIASGDAVKIHNLSICSGTRLYDEAMEGEITVPSTFHHVDNLIWFLRHIPSSMVVQRLTSDVPANRLAAPRTLKKGQVFSILDREMERRDVRQGDLL